MPTEELENELRRAFARAAADIHDPEQAGQRLLRRNYRPGHGHRRLAAGITAATAAGGLALGLGLTGTPGPGPGPGHGHDPHCGLHPRRASQRHGDADHQPERPP
jgi:hypothetical protein